MQAVHLAGLCTPRQLRIQLCAVGGSLCSQCALETGRQHHAGHVALCALHQSNGGFHVGVGLIAGGNGHSLRDLAVKVVGADHAGCRAGARVDAVEGHQVQTLGHLLCKAVRKGTEHVHLGILGCIQELVGHAGAVFDLQRHDGDRLHGQAARALGTVFGHDVHLFVQSEGKLFLAVERNRRCAAQLCQCGCASGFLDEAGDQLFREQGSFAQNICHDVFSFSRCSSAGW